MFKNCVAFLHLNVWSNIYYGLSSQDCGALSLRGSLYWTLFVGPQYFGLKKYKKIRKIITEEYPNYF